MNPYLIKVERLAIQNKYLKWYKSFIQSAILRAKSKDQAFVILKMDIECHHIYPKSMCENEEQKTDQLNYAYLSLREHFVCHWLLTKIFIGDNKKKMCWSFKNTRNWKNKYSNSFSKIKRQHTAETLDKIKQSLLDKHGVDNAGKTENSRQAAKARMESDKNPGLNQSDTTKDKIKSSVNAYLNLMSQEERSVKYGKSKEENAFFGKKHSEESIQKMRDADIGKATRKSIWMHNFLGTNIRVKLENLNEAYEQGCLKGYAPGTHPNLRRNKKKG